MSDLRRQRASSGSTAAALFLLAVALTACGGSAPSASGTSGVADPLTSAAPPAPTSQAVTSTATPNTDGTAQVNYDDATDPGAAAQDELVLNQEVRADGGMAALIGDSGQAVFDELDAQASAFSQESLEQIAHLVDTGQMPEGATSAAPAQLVAMVVSGLPSRQDEPSGDIDLSVFAETGFTTSAMLSLTTGAIQLADQTITGSVPRSDHSESTSNGLRQVVDLNMTWVINSGGGKISFEVQLSATDNIFNATDGSFVALYTSTSDGKFDINACPEEGGIARGTYNFQTKHEMNDVSGAAHARSGATRAVVAPFMLQNGDDAHLLRIETTLDMAADAHGPGANGSADAFDWTATQKLPIVMNPSGSTTSESGSGLSARGTGAERAAGSMFNSSVMAQLLLAQIGRETETFWRSGKCIELTPSRDTGTVHPNEQVDLSVTAAGKFQRAEIAQPIKATFNGAQSLDPTGEPVPYPPTFTFLAGPKKGDKGTIDLQQVSNRGIGKRTVEFTVGSPHFGGTIHYDAEAKFLAERATYDITVEVELLVDDTSRALTAEPDGGSTFNYHFHTTGGNKNAGSDCNNCPGAPPCTSHGEGRLVDPAQLKPGGPDGALNVRGTLGDDLLHLQIIFPTSCGGRSLGYLTLACGDADGLKAESDGDSNYRIDSTCKTDLSRPGLVNTAKAHVKGTLSLK